MNDLIVKNVDVMGDSIMAAKDAEGVIWVGINYFCQGLSMNKKQRDWQVKKAKEDKTISKGCRLFSAGVFDVANEVYALRLDFIPMWLAKITITDKMEQEHPELAAKLLNYQLKAKDILAEAFLPIKNVPQTIPEQIQLLAQGHVELNKRMEEVQEEVNTVKNDLESFKLDLPILPIEAERIVKAAKKKGVYVLGGREATAYKTLVIRQKVYTDLYWEMKHQFNVRSYKEICRRDVDKAISVIENYTPPLYLAKEIAEANK